MFDRIRRPEYTSYIQLCRELRLEREFSDGDVVSWHGDEPGGELDVLVGWVPKEEGHVWLPRLDQWYALIRATWVRGGGPSIDLYGDDERGFRCEIDDRSVTEHGEGKTPEESAARLWMAVAGRTVA